MTAPIRQIKNDRCSGPGTAFPSHPINSLSQSGNLAEVARKKLETETAKKNGQYPHCKICLNIRACFTFIIYLYQPANGGKW
jgi:hypothetical protein